MKYIVLSLLSAFAYIACSNAQPEAKVSTNSTTDESAAPTGDPKVKKVVKSEAEWREQLTEAEYKVLREAGTERAFTGDLLEVKEAGVFVCAGCAHPLFSSETKFESGTGWPSFYAPISDTALIEKADNSYGMRRVEILCAKCEGHQGHVFEDGPEPTGLRYCINSVSMDFVPQY